MSVATGLLQGEAAAAINWVLKDGAGRLGRFLFARWGRELDCELKQFRLAGDLLMEAGEAAGWGGCSSRKRWEAWGSINCSWPGSRGKRWTAAELS